MSAVSEIDETPFDENESDDDAPEDISLSDAKKNALERQIKERETIRLAKTMKKNKRKKYEEKHDDGKQTKKELDNLEKLPDDILAALTPKNEKIVETDDVITEDTTEEGQDLNSLDEKADDDDDDDDEEEDLGGFSDQSDEESKVQNIITAHILNSKDVEYKSKSEQGREFLRNHFYGDRVKRVASSTLLPREKGSSGGRRGGSLKRKR